MEKPMTPLQVTFSPPGHWAEGSNLRPKTPKSPHPPTSGLRPSSSNNNSARVLTMSQSSMNTGSATNINASPRRQAGFHFSQGYKQQLNRLNSVVAPLQAAKQLQDKVIQKHNTKNIYEGLNLGVLMELRESFFKKDLEAGDALTLDEFLHAFKTTTNTQMHEEDLVAMFMKIDANSDGTVDWDEFTNFLLLVDEGARRMQEAALEQDLLPATDLPTPPIGDMHKGMIDCITMVEWPLFCFITAGRDGWLKFWNYNTLSLVRKIEHQVHHSKMMETLLHNATGSARIRMAAVMKDAQSKGCQAWITSMEYLTLSCRLAVGCIDRSITFYDMTNFERACRLGYLEHVPTSITWQYINDNQQVMAFGDQGGYLHVYNMERSFNFISASSLDSAVDSNARRGVGYGILSEQTFKLHSDWITKVKYIRELDLLITSSLDSRIKLYDLNKLEFLRAFRGHKKGVYSFEFCKVAKIVASVGMSRQALIWNPYTLDIIANLNGHNANVIEICVDENNQRIMTLSEDKMIMCWDIGTFNKTQTLVDSTVYRPDNTVTSMFWDGAQDILLTAGNYLTGWRTKKTIKRKEHSHEHPLCSALYNEDFSAVVSADTNSTIQVWNIKSGTIVFRFSKAHGNSKITAMTFDSTGRRLITGAHNGTIHMWNYNNGQCIKTYGNKSKSETFLHDSDSEDGMAEQMSNEITTLLYIDKSDPKSTDDGTRFVVSCGWDKKIRVFLDSDVGQISALRTMPGPQVLGHREDILCMAHCPPHHLATGSQDGTIMIWGFDTGVPRFTLYSCDYDDPSSPHAIDAIDVLNQGRIQQAKKMHSGILDDSGEDYYDSGPESSESSSLSEVSNAEHVPFDESFAKKIKVPKLGKVAGGGLDRGSHWGMYGGMTDTVANKGLSPLLAARILKKKKQAKLVVERRKQRKKEATAGRRIRGAAHLVLGMQGALVSHQENKSAKDAANESRFASSRSAPQRNKTPNGDRSQSNTLLRKSPVPPHRHHHHNHNYEDEQRRRTMRPVEAMIYLERHKMLLTTGTDSKLRFWRVRDGSLVFWTMSNHPGDFGVTCLATDAAEKYLLTSCSGGYVKVWQLLKLHTTKHTRLHRRKSLGDNQRDENRKILATEALRPLRLWKGHEKAIVSIAFVKYTDDESGKVSNMVLTASADCDVSLWTLLGHHIGIFGSTSQWKLDSLASWKSPQPAELIMEELVINEKETELRDAANAVSSMQAAINAAKLFAGDQGNGLAMENLRQSLIGKSRRMSVSRGVYSRGISVAKTPKTVQRKDSMSRVDKFSEWNKREEAREKEEAESKANQAHILYQTKKSQLKKKLIKSHLSEFVNETGTRSLEERAKEAKMLLSQTAGMQSGNPPCTAVAGSRKARMDRIRRTNYNSVAHQLCAQDMDPTNIYTEAKKSINSLLSR